jgi:hypothetical protein
LYTFKTQLNAEIFNLLLNKFNLLDSIGPEIGGGDEIGLAGL